MFSVPKIFFLLNYWIEKSSVHLRAYLLTIKILRKQIDVPINLTFYLFAPFSPASAHTVDTTIDEYPGVSGITTARDAMRNLSEEDKEKIATQVPT